MRDLLIIGGGAPGGLGEQIKKDARGIHRGRYGLVSTTTAENYDVSRWSSHADAARSMKSVTEGDLDIVYVAGVNRLGKIGELDQTDVAYQYQVNVLGFIFMLDAFAKEFAEARLNIVAIVSDSSRIPMRGSIAYASSKAALSHAIKCAAREMAPGWRITGVSPGIIDETPMTDSVDAIVPGLRGWTVEEARNYERSLIPMGRRATKTEVSDLVHSTLNGPWFMTGSIIDITGGK